MIPKEKIEEIRNRSDIVAVISEYVPLKKRGRNYLGLCPFHSEKDPSFTVSSEKQLFHCFGCGEGGNVFAFIMKIENIGFVEAAAELAAKIGLPLERPQSGGSSKNEQEKIYEVTLLAAGFFRKCFEEETGRVARDYVEKRGINAETAKIFGLGFAPDGWDHLFKHLISRGVAPDLIERAGLILPRENQDGYYDRFRSRLVFPISDPRGRVIAFSGRALGEVEPKYLNSPDTPVYRKGESVFGLNLTKDNIKKEKFALLVEGNLDLLSAYQSGAANVAAPLGTALTTSQCKLLARFTDSIVLAFDADAAGEAAAERSAEILRSQGLKVKVAEFQGAKDPDEFIQKQGADAFQKAIHSALPFLEFKIKRTLKRHDLAEIEARSRALREIAEILSREQDAFVQKEYAKTAARLINVDPETVLAEIKRLGFYRRDAEKDLRRVTEKPASKVAEAEKRLIALSTQNISALETVKKELGLAGFNSPEAKAIAEILFSAEAEQAQNLPHFVVDNLGSESARNFLTQVLLSENLEKPEEVLRDCIQVIKAESSRSRVNALKTELRQAETAKDAQKAAELLAALKNEIS